MRLLAVQAFASIFEGVLIYYWVRAFSREKQVLWFRAALEIILISGWIMVSWTFFTNPMVMISFTALGAMFLFYRYSVSLKKAVLATFVFCVIMALCDVLASYLVVFFGKTDLTGTRFVPGYMLAANITTKFLILIFVSFVYAGGVTGGGKISLRKSIYILALPTASIVILYQMTTYTDMEKGRDAFLCILGICGLFVANIYAFTFFEKEERLEKQRGEEAFLKQQIENERRYYKSLAASVEEVRKIRHNLKNTFTALYGYLEAGNIAVAKHFIQESSARIALLKSGTGYPALDALLYAKTKKAEQTGVHFETQLALPSNLSVDEMDLCIILGNALDNALEASVKLPAREQHIGLKISPFGEMLTVEVSNNIVEEKIETFQTSKEDKKNHGLGFKTICDLIKKYDGTVQVVFQNHQFKLILNMNL